MLLLLLHFPFQKLQCSRHIDERHSLIEINMHKICREIKYLFSKCASASFYFCMKIKIPTITTTTSKKRKRMKRKSINMCGALIVRLALAISYCNLIDFRFVENTKGIKSMMHLCRPMPKKKTTLIAFYTGAPNSQVFLFFMFFFCSAP